MLTSTATAAENFPTRPIRLIIPSGAGGVTDILARHIAPKLGDALGQQVVYKGGPQALTVLLSGEIEFYLVGSVSTAVQQVKAGRVRALGVGARQRNAQLPDVPPIADLLPGYEARGWNGILAPAGTPRAIIERLNQVLVKIVRSSDMAPALAGEGATAVGNTPAEFDAVIRADIAKWAKIIKDSNSRPQ